MNDTGSRVPNGEAPAIGSPGAWGRRPRNGSAPVTAWATSEETRRAGSVV